MDFKTWMLDAKVPDKWHGTKLWDPIGGDIVNDGFMTLRFNACYAAWINSKLVFLVDRVLKYEEGIANGIEQVLELNTEQSRALHSMEKINVSSRDNYREYYDEELINYVKTHDAYILDRFGYEF